MAPMDVAPEQWGNLVPEIGVTLRFWSPERASEIFIASFIELGGQA